MSTTSIIPVILAGGTGSRLWPLSRQQYPKQYLPLVTENTMLQETVIRLDGMSNVENPIIVCNEDHRFLVAEQMQRIRKKAGEIILEQTGRNTASAVAVAAISAIEGQKDPVLLVLPADHIIQQNHEFHEAIDEGYLQAQDDKLVTFGIIPDAAETGYGYIRKGEMLPNGSTFEVHEFVEKPDKEIAREYVKNKEYLWNSGMFMFKANTYLAELQRYEPELLSACENAYQYARNDLDFKRLHDASFVSTSSKSVDYAVMEKTPNSVVIPLDAGWSDVGSWSSLWEAVDKDKSNNALIGDVLELDTHNSYIHSTGRLITAVGVQNTIVIETADAVLVADKSKAQHVKKMVDLLLKENSYKSKFHRKVYRPWGNYDSIDKGDRFQVKRIIVNIDSALSLQLHHHRAEHWIVVSGTARVTNGNEEVILNENQSTYIPLGVKHRLENIGLVPLEIIEIQSGDYLGEDDIVRFDDNYGRMNIK